MPSLPLVKAFEIPALGVTLTDVLEVSPLESARASGIMVDVLQRQVLNQQRPGTEVCGVTSDLRLRRLYTDARAADPSLTVNDWLVALGEDVVLDDSDTDPRLEDKTFTVAETSSSELLGVFTLYNIRRLAGSGPRLLKLQAMPMPGCRPAPGLTLRATWSGLLRYILEEPLEFARRAGRQLDVQCWAFPTRAGHRWLFSERAQRAAGGDSANAAAVGTRLAVADLGDHVIESSARGVPLRVTRRGL
jgi:hypothetical protein